jgi:site-specific DNA recombinase
MPRSPQLRLHNSIFERHTIAGLRKRRDLIRRQYARGDIEELDDYRAMRSEIDQNIEELQAGLSKLRTTRAANLLPTDGRIREAWEQGDLHWRRSVVQLVVERVIVKPGSPGARMYKGRRFSPSDVEIVYRVLDDQAIAALAVVFKAKLRGESSLLAA